MSLRRPATVVAAGLAVVLGGALLSAGPATAAPAPGTRSLAALLTADGDRFDHDGKDYDIVTEAVLAVLAAKPKSPVGVLTDGSAAVTAFVPRDDAFRRLVKDLTGTSPASEEKAFDAVAGLGVDTVETVLLYHVVPGAAIIRKQAFRSDGALLTTALDSTLTVDVNRRHDGSRYVKLVDADRTDRDGRVVAFDLNKGNVQIAHGVDRVLRPLDLP